MSGACLRRGVPGAAAYVSGHVLPPIGNAVATRAVLQAAATLGDVNL